MIRSAKRADAGEICRIYNPYVLDTIFTFEETVVDTREMALRIDRVRRADLPWLVYEQEDGAMLGYAYAARWRSRAAYRHTAESTIYVDESARGRGIGKRLYGALLAALADRRMHTVIAGIALPNEASVALHERLGFNPAARFESVGRKFDRWIDVGYWQLIFE